MNDNPPENSFGDPSNGPDSSGGSGGADSSGDLSQFLSDSKDFSWVPRDEQGNEIPGALENAELYPPLKPIYNPKDDRYYLPDKTLLEQRPIVEEMHDCFIDYAMSVIISRAIPDVRDGLKPSQRRILVAMNDLGLSPSSHRVKCAKISGDTSGNYHPHGEAIIYPTLVRMAQEWNMRYVLVDKQGNFGSIAGLPAAAMRYTEARLSAMAMSLLEDLKLDTVDYVPTYDERNLEPTVLPSKAPNLLINGSDGIAVGMATSIPPHNIREVCDAAIAIIDRPSITGSELLRICPGPDFPTGGIVSRKGLKKAYLDGRGSIFVRAQAEIVEKKGKTWIVIHSIPYKQSRDAIVTQINNAISEGKIDGVSKEAEDLSDLKEPVRIQIELKKGADPELALNQLFRTTTLQTTYPVILLALVDNQPRVLSFKEMLEEFIRHRTTVIRRRTAFLLNRAMKRLHTIEGLLIAHANIEEVIRICRFSDNAKADLCKIQCPAALLQRALGDTGFEMLVQSRGARRENYFLTPVQADAILRMTLSQLNHLEQKKLGDEYNTILDDCAEYRRILSDDSNILAVVRSDLEDIKKKFADKRRTVLDTFGPGDDLESVPDDTMVVTISENDYIKRTPSVEYRTQDRGGKGMLGAQVDQDNQIKHLFVANNRDYILFFTNRGKVYWKRVHKIPESARSSKGRSIANLLTLERNDKNEVIETIADGKVVRDLSEPDRYLIMATKSGLVKKTPLSAYSRPQKNGIIAIKLKDDDELIDVGICGPGDEVVLSTAHGMAIRFRQSDARSMGRNSSGVRGIHLHKGDSVVGMVIADEKATLLTICADGIGKRTPFGPNSPVNETAGETAGETGGENTASDSASDTGDTANDTANDTDDVKSRRSYRVQSRGGYGLRDIIAGKRQSQVIGIVSVNDDDEMVMITSRGKIQRVAVSQIPILGRNTRGVRIMKVDTNDQLVAINRIPPEEQNIEEQSGKSGKVPSANSADSAGGTGEEARREDSTAQKDNAAGTSGTADASGATDAEQSNQGE